MSRVWIVDDSPLDAERARQSLASLCAVEVFKDGSEALERLSSSSPPDAIVLDQVMPGVTGLELVKFMRSERMHMAQVPVLLLTSNDQKEQIVEGLEAGANDYLAKPFAPEELRARVDALLRSAALLERAASAERSLASVLGSLPDAVLALDGRGTISFANAEAARVFGMPQLLGQPVSALLPGLSLKRRADGRFASLPDVEVNGRIYSPSLGALPHEGHEQTTVVLRDVTERRQLDERRLDFYSIIAHDMRSPLTAMLLRVNRVLGGKLGDADPRVKRELSKLDESMKSMTAIINDFLVIARLDGTAQKLLRADLDIGSLVEGAVDELRPIAEASGVAVEVDAPVGERLVGEAARLKQAVSNLVSNAIKFTPAGGQVTVRVEPSHDAVKLSVRDTGPGMAPELLPQLFGRYIRAPDEVNKAGSGLGLMIVRQIVEAHGGEVGADSTPGQGSTFWFTLPR